VKKHKAGVGVALVVVLAVGCGRREAKDPSDAGVLAAAEGEGVATLTTAVAARASLSRWPSPEEARWEPERYTSSLDRRRAWSPESVESLLDRSQAEDDPILLALAPGVEGEVLEGIPGLRIVGTHAFGIYSAQVLAPGRALAEELINLGSLEVLALDDRMSTGQDSSETGALIVDGGNAVLIESPTQLNEAGDAVANDPLYSTQWQLWGGPRESLGPFGASTPTSPGGANVPPAWGKVSDARGVVVAVLDTGADSEHGDLAFNLLEGEQVGLEGPVLVRPNFEDPEGHGTMVAGVIAAVGNNGYGTAGVCWRAKVKPIRVEVDGVIRLSAVIDGIHRATLAGARVINISLGTESSNFLLFNALRAATAGKALVVVSAGNEGVDLDVDPRFPASYDLPNLITVAALDREGELASFSNYGKETVDLAAPGVDVATTFPNNTFVLTSGTSFSAPMVAGAAALIMAKHPDRGLKFVRERLFENARRPESLRGKVERRRQLDVGRAVRPRLGKRP
jgi:subtilisin family serine protease